MNNLKRLKLSNGDNSGLSEASQQNINYDKIFEYNN